MKNLTTSLLTIVLLTIVLLAGAVGCAREDAPASAPDAVAASSEPAPPAPGRLGIVDRAIALHGGDLYRASETELDVCSKSGCFHLRARLDGDLFEYEVSSQSDSGSRRVLWTSETLELHQDGARVDVAPDDEQTWRDWVMARVYFPFLPYRLDDPGVYKEDLGPEDWEGRTLHKVKVTFKPGSSTDADDEYLYWFDPETGRVEQFAYSFHTNYGGLRFRRGQDYRRIDGILFFDHENLGVDGDGFSVDMLTPEFVAERLEPISTVRFENIEVRPLE